MGDEHPTPRVLTAELPPHAQIREDRERRIHVTQRLLELASKLSGVEGYVLALAKEVNSGRITIEHWEQERPEVERRLRLKWVDLSVLMEGPLP